LLNEKNVSYIALDRPYGESLCKPETHDVENGYFVYDAIESKIAVIFHLFSWCKHWQMYGTSFCFLLSSKKSCPNKFSSRV
jgi:hypothetical protein